MSLTSKSSNMGILEIITSILLLNVLFLISFTLANSNTYIIHMDSSAMPKAFSTHHSWYSSLLSSVSETTSETEDDSSSLATCKHLYTYTNTINGFSAILTLSELESLKNSFGYISHTRDASLKLHTTHTSQFLGLTSVSGAWTAPNQGEDVIIGLLDTGIWPESESFSDEGMTKVPQRWKGICQFNSFLCNNKLIGARFYNKGLIADNPGVKIPFLNSPRDSNGHGTHTSSTAAGNYVKNASYFGYALGTAKGMAPRARIAMYKVSYKYGTYASDVIAAMDQAIADGVDILSVSLGYDADERLLEEDPIAIAGFRAMEKGVPVVASAGNDGTIYYRLLNGAPWLLTVAAGTLDRQFYGVLTLGDGVEINFQTLYPGKYSLNQMPLVYNEKCDNETELRKLMKNKIIVCKDNFSLSDQYKIAESAKVSAAVFIFNDSSWSEFSTRYYSRSSFPAAFLSIQDGGDTLINYIKKNSDPRGSFQFQKTTKLGTKPAPHVADYSSRGPYLRCPSILKPDIMAPGTQVLASWSPIGEVTTIRSRSVYSNFNFNSGTSMATPHVAGVAALIKKAHPDWSPAAIRSAIMTTASVLDNTNSPIKDPSMPGIPAASPLDMGTGHISPIKALDPGLVYDATTQDYIKVPCAMNYTSRQIRIFTNSSYSCKSRSLDLNYPSFIAFFPDDQNNSTSNQTVVHVFQRTVTNVAKGGMAYTAKVTGMDGIKVKVEPQKLIFKQIYEKQSYKLSLEGPKSLKKDIIFGYLSWVDDGGKYLVRSPIVATNMMP
ncbi:hypothetical protein CCACVL1_07334 [Corchorus capsularis]|uniref:Peptidase S8/S53 domain-containing protein n=1 Tax=Corchorus capsularis TaxID=210143 RepID=A0A1R3J710_COCAP|nr:hypothetical protein CCACVL1_07334 [Corchorus capsularis]